MKKTKPSKNTIPLLMLLLLSTLALANLPITATANPGTTIEVVSIYTEPEERNHWNVLKAAFEAEYAGQDAQHPDIDITLAPVEMDDMYDEITERHLMGTDPDVVFMHAMWLPRWAHYEDPIVAPAPDDVAYDVWMDFVIAARDAATYKGVVYGIPTEFNSWALIYNRQIIQDKINEPGLPAGDKTFLEGVLYQLDVTKVPLNYADLQRAARLLTKWEAGKIKVCGFMPGTADFGNEEKRYEFTTLLWSNKGEVLDLTEGIAKFNSPAGLDVMNLFDDLSILTCDEPKTTYASYDPVILPGVGWTAWYEETVAMVIGPTWLTYVRGAMGARFSHIGIAPIPVGPQTGATSRSLTYAWMMAVTNKSATEGRGDAAWTFLKWLDEPRGYDYIKPTPALPIGAIPKASGVSIMGDWLITDSTMPGRKNDQLNGWVSVGGVPTTPLSDDDWFAGFMREAKDRGRSDEAFLKSEEVQDKIGFMWEQVTIFGAPPAGTLTNAEDEVNDILPKPGDIDIDGVVGTGDATLLVLDYGAMVVPPNPPSENWNRGRSDVNDDNLVDIEDATLVMYNWG